MFRACNARSAGAVEDHLYLVDRLPNHFQCIQESRTGDDCGAVLIVVEDWDFHRLLESLFDVEALRRLDVFEVNAAKRGFEQLAQPYDFVGIVGIYFEVEHVDIGEPLEQNALPFHDGFSGESSDVAEPEDCRAVADHGNQVSPRGVLESVMRILLDLKTGNGDAGSVGEAEIALRTTGFAGSNFNLSGPLPVVIIQRLLFGECHASLPRCQLIPLPRTDGDPCHGELAGRLQLFGVRQFWAVTCVTVGGVPRRSLQIRASEPPQS